MVTSTPAHHRSSTAQAAAVGLTVFAAVMLMITGILGFFRGLMAVLEDKVFLTTPNYVFEFDLTTWGWIHLILGIVAIGVSAALFRALTWARVVGIAIASLVVIANFLSIPSYPFWSLTLIALNGFVIWGLCVVRRDDV
ncbi:DUF7144 family membrane protein [Streptomyces kanamyceticus]|uniref:DUF7144 domain-containing protein n=1 Tax=Streptomyces kanamyceticus TaxID=1967 RepID=A0A5J6GCL9_STRKN|nr:hypothetical protein [Streptomyces kanamyceticus]QEU93299.1 hypothetical protein CP970_22345 [Streptomyces kanamyceticus]